MKEVTETKLVKTATTKTIYQSDDGNYASEGKESVEIIKVKDCLSCPFRRCTGNRFDECGLLRYSTISNRSEVLDNCPLKVGDVVIKLEV